MIFLLSVERNQETNKVWSKRRDLKGKAIMEINHYSYLCLLSIEGTFKYSNCLYCSCLWDTKSTYDHFIYHAKQSVKNIALQIHVDYDVIVFESLQYLKNESRTPPPSNAQNVVSPFLKISFFCKIVRLG